MFWMAMIGVGLLAGFVFLESDDEVETSETITEEEQPDDAFTGASGDDEITGNRQDNTLLGRNGDDDLAGQRGSDRVFGDGGMDTVSGGGGDDSVFGGNGDDFVTGDRGDDMLRGGRDHDILLDNQGSDSLHGDLGQDLIIASGQLLEGTIDNLEQDRSLENGARDLLEQLGIDFSEDTDSRGDSVDGGEGDDTLVFGVDDTVIGGSGKDLFVTASWLEGEPAATITDFSRGEDQLIYGYDPLDGPAPALTVDHLPNETEGSDAIVYADGVEVIRVLDQDGTFDPAQDIRVIPYGARATT